jgi:hypothetical protein
MRCSTRPTSAPLAVALAAEGGGPEPDRVAGAVRRIDAAAVRVAPRARGGWGGEEDVAWADDIALRSVVPVRGAPRVRAACDVVTVDDDVGGPFPPPPATRCRSPWMEGAWMSGSSMSRRGRGR